MQVQPELPVRPPEACGRPQTPRSDYRHQVRGERHPTAPRPGSLVSRSLLAHSDTAGTLCLWVKTANASALAGQCWCL